MKLIMDADCLIKLTKGQAKEPVCRAFTVVVPRSVKREVVDDGKGRPDAAAVARNIAEGLLTIAATAPRLAGKGEEEALTLYTQGGFDGICSDDRRFLARLRTLGIPYLTPAVLLLVLVRRGVLTRREGSVRLQALAPYISADEYAVANLRLATLE